MTQPIRAGVLNRKSKQFNSRSDFKPCRMVNFVGAPSTRWAFRCGSIIIGELQNGAPALSTRESASLSG